MSTANPTGGPTGVPSEARPGPAAPRRAIAAGVASVLLLVGTAAAGPSAAVPPLGPRSWRPPWAADLHLAPGTVTVALVAAYLLAAGFVWFGLAAVRGGWRPAPAAVAAAALLAVLALVLTPPFGSADHLNYAAYGRIAAQGGDPYAEPPSLWRGGHDPVASAAQEPWRDTTSVYGPMATAMQAAASLLGGESVRLTVWFWQLLVGGCFLLTGWMIDRAVRGSPLLRARAGVLWTLNPLLLGSLVGGAHLDAVCAAVATLALLLGTGAHARPGAIMLAGVAVGVAAGMKLPYGAVGLALLWAYRRLPAAQRVRAAARLTLGAGTVLLVSHLWAGPHVFDQARAASRSTSLATPWRAVVNLLRASTGLDPGPLVPAMFAVVASAVLLAMAGLARRPPGPGDPCPGQNERGQNERGQNERGQNERGQNERGQNDLDPNRMAAVRALLALAVAYLVASPYVLPWYDALVWVPLALAGGWPIAGTARPGLEGLLLLRLTALSLAYVPGLAGGTSAAESLMLRGRSYLAPLVTAAVLVWVLARGLPPAVRGAQQGHGQSDQHQRS